MRSEDAVTTQLTNGLLLDEERPGWSVSCPSCANEVRYTVLNIASGVDVYLHCDSCSDFVLRPEDQMPHPFDPSTLAAHYGDLERTLPPCGCGGTFRLWANVRCGGCGSEFPYDNGNQNLETRLGEAKVVWLESAVAYRGVSMPSNKLRKVVTGG
jgi:ribosomal protein S27E